MNNQRIFRTSAVQGALLGCLIAFFVLLVSTQNIIIAIFSTGNIVAKVHQPGLDPRKIEIDAGPGVDVLAITILASAVAAAVGSGSGGLAGAGIH